MTEEDVECQRLSKWWRHEMRQIRRAFMNAQDAWDRGDAEGLGARVLRGDMGYALGSFWMPQLREWLTSHGGEEEKVW
jgi:hypothetical protein